jgi:hypothetical protein
VESLKPLNELETYLHNSFYRKPPFFTAAKHLLEVGPILIHNDIKYVVLSDSVRNYLWETLELVLIDILKHIYLLKAILGVIWNHFEDKILVQFSVLTSKDATEAALTKLFAHNEPILND